MKLVNKKEFFKLQTPIIYSIYLHGDCTGLFECFEFWKDDDGNIFEWLYTPYLIGSLLPKLKDETKDAYIERNNLSEKMLDELDEIFFITKKGNSFELDLESGSRDGLFNKDDIFMIYEKTDLLNLINKLQSIFIEKYSAA